MYLSPWSRTTALATFASEALKGAATMPPSVNATKTHRRSTWPTTEEEAPAAAAEKKAPAPAQTPVTSAKRHRELAELEELAHIQSIVNKGDTPFIFIADRTKQKDAPLDGIGMWFNKGNNSMNVQLTVIHEIRHLTTEEEAPAAAAEKKAPAPALTPVTSAKRHRELAELEELAHIQSIVNKGDPPFIFIADRTKQKDAPLDGIGMWFNKGNNSTNVQLTVIHEIRMVHVQKVISPPASKQFRQLPTAHFQVAKSMYASSKAKPVAAHEVEYSVEIPKGYSCFEYVTFQTEKFIGLWFKKIVRTGENFADDSSEGEEFQCHGRKKKSQQKLLSFP
ncbi:hypothetical protein AAMO2058_000698700 [Amorphochlora amoebiformis]